MNFSHKVRKKIQLQPNLSFLYELKLYDLLIFLKTEPYNFKNSISIHTLHILQNDLFNVNHNNTAWQVFFLLKPFSSLDNL